MLGAARGRGGASSGAARAARGPGSCGCPSLGRARGGHARARASTSCASTPGAWERWSRASPTASLRRLRAIPLAGRGARAAERARARRRLGARAAARGRPGAAGRRAAARLVPAAREARRRRDGRGLARPPPAARAPVRGQAHPPRAARGPTGASRRRALPAARRARSRGSARRTRCRLYDFGVSDSGSPYFVMELLEGTRSGTPRRALRPAARPSGRSRCCGRRAARSPRRTGPGCSTATSSRRTSCCAGSASSATWRRCSTSASPSRSGGADADITGEGALTGTPGLHRPRAGDRRRRGRALGPVLARLRRVLRPDRPGAVRRGPDGRDDPPRAHAPARALLVRGPAASSGRWKRSSSPAWRRTRPAARARRSSCGRGSGRCRSTARWTQERAERWWREHAPRLSPADGGESSDTLLRPGSPTETDGRPRRREGGNRGERHPRHRPAAVRGEPVHRAVPQDADPGRAAADPARPAARAGEPLGRAGPLRAGRARR